MISVLLFHTLGATYQEAVRVLQDTFHISLTFACKRLDHYINNHLYASQMHW